MICKKCGQDFHHCPSCGYDPYLEGGYCSPNCFKNTPEERKHKVLVWLEYYSEQETIENLYRQFMSEIEDVYKDEL